MRWHSEAMYSKYVRCFTLIAVSVDQGRFRNGRFDERIEPAQIGVFSTVSQELIDVLGNEMLVNWPRLGSRFDGVVHDLSWTYARFQWISGSSL